VRTMKQGRKASNLAGKRFGKVVALERVGTWISPKSALWLCRCDCGAQALLASHHFRDRRDPSCDACVVEPLGFSRDSAYGCYRAMIARCEDPKTHGYYLYGGRGIRVCKRWRESFLAFLKDLGPRPSLDHSLGRINHDGPYAPGNVRWETREEQVASRRAPNTARFAKAVGA
jgi:hypothetical protein